MKARPYWQDKALQLLEDRNVLWLSGVRRSGKTMLCQSLSGAAYFDCELPRVRATLEDPESFLRQQRGRLIVLDEIHRLLNPSEILKIAADHFPTVKVIATGSSTLTAKSKFRDTLTGRKHELWLTPAVASDAAAFGIEVEDADRRMLHGGLPPFLLAASPSDSDYQEWLDSYWAKDLQELFVVEKRAAFFKFVELLMRQSGELFEAQAFAAPCEISRQTVQNYLQILEATLLMTVLRPYSGGRATELKSQPKVYAFDTGFVAYTQGVDKLRDEDRGRLLKHLVLNELCAAVPRNGIYYWRDKQAHEVDFVVKAGRGKRLICIECKAKASKFDPGNLHIFRKIYPEGPNFVVSLDVHEPYTRDYKGLPVTHLPYWRIAEGVRS